MDDRLYLVTYDIANQRRWRRVFKLMNGYGDWLQLSVFQCRLGRRRRAELGAALDRLIHQSDDHVLIIELGPADRVAPRVASLGKSFAAVVREPIIV